MYTITKVAENRSIREKTNIMLQQDKIKTESMEKLNFIKAIKFTKYNLKEISNCRNLKEN